MEPQINLQTGQRIVHGKYSILNKIGFGSYASVYSVGLQKRGRTVVRAIKIQHDKVSTPQISTQISVLKNIQGTNNADIGFTKFYQYGYEAEYNYIVMQLLGPNLQQLMKLCGGKLSLKTVLIIGLQIIDRIQVLHNSGFIYRDIKPENFLMGLQNKSQILHIIDFGKCRRYRNKQTGKHIPYKQNTKFDGQFMYSSINTHNNTQYSRRDDIEGFLYMMIYLSKGKLPWNLVGRQFKNKKQKQCAIQQIKKKLPIQHLTYKLPMQFIDLLYYVRTLNFYQKPDYDYIRLIMHRMFNQEEDNLSMIFDWNKMEQLDFAIYNGEPRLVLRDQEMYKNNKEENDQYTQTQEKNHIKESNSLDAKLLAEEIYNSNKGRDSMKESVVQRFDKRQSNKMQKENHSPTTKQSKDHANLFDFLN